MSETTVLAGPPERLRPRDRFTAAYRELAPKVTGYLRARGVDDPEAVTQEVFLALLAKPDEVRGGDEGLRTLLFTIAHAKAVDHHRRRSRTPALVEYEPEHDRRVTASAEDDALEAQTGVLAMLTALAPEYREVLALRIVAELTLESTAAVMNRSVGAVKQLQRRALIALRTRVAAEAGARS
ncbi:MAG: sigma-70 family RNA polymerase sigma factor [Acidobacteria bacterium]|nr:sigma-70 family RNA polymerase sigma factor [Acidobacteriota bacterium]